MASHASWRREDWMNSNEGYRNESGLLFSIQDKNGLLFICLFVCFYQCKSVWCFNFLATLNWFCFNLFVFLRVWKTSSIFFVPRMKEKQFYSLLRFYHILILFVPNCVWLNFPLCTSSRCCCCLHLHFNSSCMEPAVSENLVMIIMIIVMMAFKGAIWDFCNLLTALWTVSNT